VLCFSNLIGIEEAFGSPSPTATTFGCDWDPSPPWKKREGTWFPTKYMKKHLEQTRMRYCFPLENFPRALSSCLFSCEIETYRNTILWNYSWPFPMNQRDV
jgi:hypothetical protein